MAAADVALTSLFLWSLAGDKIPSKKFENQRHTLLRKSENETCSATAPITAPSGKVLVIIYEPIARLAHAPFGTSAAITIIRVKDANSLKEEQCVNIYT